MKNIEFGWINVFGTMIVVIMLVPNIIYVIKNEDLENKYKNKLVNTVEQLGRYVSLILTIFPIGIYGFKIVDLQISFCDRHSHKSHHIALQLRRWLLYHKK